MVEMAGRDPFTEMRDRMERVFRNFQYLERHLPEAGFSAVPVDVEESDDTVTVTADLPGLDRDHIEVNAGRDAIDIRGGHEEEVAEEQENYFRRERSSRRFQRTVSLPAPVDPDSASAEYENGVLTVKLEKTGGPEKKRVDVE